MPRHECCAAAALLLVFGLPGVAQEAARVQAQPTAEDALASIVHHAAVIFAGQVYALRLPAQTQEQAGVKGGMPSKRSDAVEVEFRVDVGIRGDASVGSTYVLHMPLSVWQQAPPFSLHQRAVVFLRAPDAGGLSGPVEGESDIPGMDVGVMPIDSSNNVDLSRLERLVTLKTIASAAQLPAPAEPNQPLSITDVTTTVGEDTLESGSRSGRMPELRNRTVPFLALVRDISVLSAAESQRGSAAK